MGDSIRFLLSILFFSCLTSCDQSLPPEVLQAYNQVGVAINFNEHIRPILSDRCFPCHGPDQGKLEAGLRLDLENIAKGFLPEHPDKRAIVSGKPGSSEMIARILSTDPELMMPPPDSKLTLNPLEKATLVKWIEKGAEYRKHWSFIKPVKADLRKDVHPVDYFVSLKLHAVGLVSKDEADRETMLRRLSFDLTGLPPSLEEMDAFLNDGVPEAYEKQVDRLLGSPHYGERMATDWMDVARYADTHGYTVDRFRDVSPWRDWVIRSFNENMPYDQFVRMQLAGDLLPDGGRDAKIATTFLRLHPQNMEGGIIPEEFRVEYVTDRTNTLGTAFMGMTMACAKCHDHKFDPISQKEYFQLFSFFNNVNEAGQISFNDAMPVPTMLLTSEMEDSAIHRLEKTINGLEERKEKVTEQLLPEFHAWISQGLYSQIKITDVQEKSSARYLLNGNLVNTSNPAIKGKMDQMNSNDEKPEFVPGLEGQGLLLNGDSWFDLGGVGAFDRYHPFSVGLNIKLPEGLRDGVILHKGIGAVLYNFRGFHLALKDGRLELLMAHTAPDNAIIKYTDEDVPINEWIQLMLTYDGSGKADGLQVFLNGALLPSYSENDHLYKSLFFNFPDQKEVGVQIGARWRGKGTGGAVVDNILVYDRLLSEFEVKAIATRKELNFTLTKKPGDLDPNEKQLLHGYFFQNHPQIKEIAEELQKKRKDLCQITDTINELMIYREMKQPRPAYVLDRGQYDSYKEMVYPSTPRAILAFDSTLSQPTRLDLANWLMHPDHPLTARVIVNRIWQQLFGRGLVKTSEDFGNQGTPPDHPEILDYLAVYFQESGWDIKGLIKLLVTSQTYRQSSICTIEERQRDPENIYLSRGPAKRLSAEMIRDQVLAASDLLNRKIGGPSVYPYQPQGLWRVNGANYVQSEGEDLYRRSLYTVWKRSVPHPAQSSFDAPERSECTTRRQQTNTPLQALVLMNDPLFVEAAGEIGRQMYLTGEIVPYYRKLTGRHPKEGELEIMTEIYEQKLAAIRKNPESMYAWFSNHKPQDVHPEMMAYAVVASTIINSDLFITKR